MKSPVYWIEGPWPGRLAIVPRPRGGDWLRDEVASWHAAGIDGVVSALTEEENEAFDLSRESALARVNGMEHLAFPIQDRGLPSSFEVMEEVARKLETDLAHGKNIAVHCRQGIGRSSLIAACILVLGGLEPTHAFARIETSRGCSVPDTPEQKEWVIRFANSQRRAMQT
jgi:protein-tyrosine phosphatase